MNKEGLCRQALRFVKAKAGSYVPGDLLHSSHFSDVHEFEALAHQHDHLKFAAWLRDGFAGLNKNCRTCMDANSLGI